MVSFDRTIPPGGVGKIKLSMSTEGFQGNIRKRARVYSNDPEAKDAYLSIMAFVKAKEGGHQRPSTQTQLSAEPSYLEPPLPESSSKSHRQQGAGEQDVPQAIEQSDTDDRTITPPMEDPNSPPPPESLFSAPAVDLDQPPPLGEEPMVSEPVSE